MDSVTNYVRQCTIRLREDINKYIPVFRGLSHEVVETQ